MRRILMISLLLIAAVTSAATAEKTASKTETTAVSKPAPKADARPDAKPDAKHESRAGATAAPEKKTAATAPKPEAKAAATPKAKPDAKSEPKADAKKASSSSSEHDTASSAAKAPQHASNGGKHPRRHSSKHAAKLDRRAPKDVLPDLTHERVDYWVSAFSTIHDYHEKIAKGFARKAKYQDYIQRELRRRGMPQNLIYLAMEESAFNPEARSGAKAVGIWQLTPDTARLYGLKVNKKVDERKQVKKETDAALRFLLHLHERFGCWYLAAAAYNTGAHRVARIMRKNLGRIEGRDRDYYRIWDKLPGETRDYVPAIIALNRIGKNPSKYGF
jgi:outer membrane biosynthesis protein TonB